MKHKISPSAKGGYLLIGPYDPAVVAEIRKLPVRARRWDPALKAWRIADGFHDAAQEALLRADDNRYADDDAQDHDGWSWDEP